MPQTHTEINIQRVMFMVWVEEKRLQWSLHHLLSPHTKTESLITTPSQGESLITPSLPALICSLHYLPLSHVTTRSSSLVLLSNFTLISKSLSPSLWHLTRSLFIPHVSTFHSLSSYFTFSFQTDVAEWNARWIETYISVSTVDTVREARGSSRTKMRGDKCERNDCRCSLRAKTSHNDGVLGVKLYHVSL